MTTRKYPLLLIILALLIVGCGQTGIHNEMSGKERDFYSTDLAFTINKISVLDTFKLATYIDVLGRPDSIIKGGPEIIEEFGFDDYDLWYGESSMSAGHGSILTANINNAGISVNGIEVGDKQTKIETTFSITLHSEKDTIKVINKNDDVLTFYLKNKTIQRISFGRPL